MRLLSILIATGLILAVLVGCGGEATPSVTRLVYGLTLMPSGFDPHIHASAELGIPLRSVYDTLVYLDPETGEFVPGLAEGWVISDDGLTYTFTLRQDVTFHDGTHFDAAAVAANLDRITDPATGSQKAVYMLGPYDHYEIVDNYTIRIVLSEPYAPLLDSLSQVYLGIASPTALEQYDTATYQFHQVGTGPYKFVEYVPGDRLVLARNPDYAWAPRFMQNQGPPYVDEIEFRFFEDPASRALALESGDAQIMGELLPSDAERLRGNSAIQLYPVSIPGQPLQFFLNTRRPPTDDIAIREALLYATNRNAIVNAVFQSFSPVAYGPLAAVTRFYDPEMPILYPFNDQGQAASLLASRGYEDADGDGILERDGEPLRIDVVVPPWGMSPEVGQLLESQWELLGIDVNLIQVPSFPALRDAAEEGEYNAIAINFTGTDPSLLNQFYLSDGALNWSKVDDPDLDALLYEATSTLDEARRAELYRQIQRRIMDLALVIPIRDYVNLNVASANITGLRFDAQGFFPILAEVQLNR